MIVTELYDGQGFGNQLWSYVFTRVLALDKELEFGIQSPQRFKGKDFMHLDMGRAVFGGSGPEGGPPLSLPEGIKYYYSERVIRHPENDVDIRMVDPGFQDLIDNTKIEGIFQAEEYISHRKDEIRNWLGFDHTQLDIDFSDPDLCVINFRGGEYARNARIFLRRKYWLDAITEVRRINPNVRFVVITDDSRRARKFFPEFEIRHYGIHGDYQAVNSAHYLILSNSSFAFFPAWLNQNLRVCIAPTYWSAHNDSDGYWGCSYNIVKGWIYLDREGIAWSHDDVTQELAKYQSQYATRYEQKRISGATLVVSSFNHDLSWVPRYSDNYFVFERGNGSGIPPQLCQERLRYVSNNGSNFRDYFDYIIENYDDLPDTVFLIKGNIFPRHVRQHVFDTFTSRKEPCSIVDPAVHRTAWPADFFDKLGKYWELNSDAFNRSGAPSKYFQRVDDLLRYFDNRSVRKIYSSFSIGGQYISGREQLRKLSRWVYEDLREIVSHGGLPVGYTVECWIVERTLDRLWQSHDMIPVRRVGQTLTVPVSAIPREGLTRRGLMASLDTVSRIVRFVTSRSEMFSMKLKNRMQLLRNEWSGGTVR